MKIGFFARHYGWYRVMGQNPDTPASTRLHVWRKRYDQDSRAGTRNHRDYAHISDLRIRFAPSRLPE